jgi:hypothetical protein
MKILRIVTAGALVLVVGIGILLVGNRSAPALPAAVTLRAPVDSAPRQTDELVVVPPPLISPEQAANGVGSTPTTPAPDDSARVVSADSPDSASPDVADSPDEPASASADSPDELDDSVDSPDDPASAPAEPDSVDTPDDSADLPDEPDSVDSPDEVDSVDSASVDSPDD